MSVTERREFLKKIAKGTVYVAPVVKTLAAPDPAKAQTVSGKMGPRPASCDVWDWWYSVVLMVNPPPPCPWWTSDEGAPIQHDIPPPPGSDPFPQAPWSRSPGPVPPQKLNKPGGPVGGSNK